MSRLLLTTIKILPAFGIVLTLIGASELYPEDWLDSKGFVINLASGLTTACFGVPIAFFIIQRLLNDRARLERKLEALDLAIATVDRLLSEIQWLVSVCDSIAVGAKLMTSALEQVKSSRTRAAQLPPGPGSLNSRKFREDISVYVSTLKIEAGRITDVGAEWSRDEALKTLEFLRGEVSTRLLVELGDSIFPATLLWGLRFHIETFKASHPFRKVRQLVEDGEHLFVSIERGQLYYSESLSRPQERDPDSARAAAELIAQIAEEIESVRSGAAAATESIEELTRPLHGAVAGG